jgi:putative glutamine amidotransferase
MSETTVRVAIIVGRELEDDPYVNAFVDSCPGLGFEVIHPGMVGAAIADSLDRCTALLLTGGADIHPERYGEVANGMEMKSVQPKRDALELSALGRAERDNWPVLALCRGMQMLNVYLVGALLQDIGESHRLTPRPAKEDLWRPLHSVEIAPGTRLAQAIGRSRNSVNSRHHPAVDSKRLGRGVTVSAMAPDGVVEAIEVPGDRFVVGVQWHPENMVFAPEGSQERASARAIFAAFEAALVAHGVLSAAEPAL